GVRFQLFAVRTGQPLSLRRCQPLLGRHLQPQSPQLSRLGPLLSLRQLRREPFHVALVGVFQLLQLLGGLSVVRGALLVLPSKRLPLLSLSLPIRLLR